MHIAKRANARPAQDYTPALEALFQSSASSQEYAAGFIQVLLRALQAVDLAAVARLIDMVEAACEQNRQIFLLGNGGSSAVASHMVVDLSPNTLMDRCPSFRVFSLTDNVESITAIANDSGYENIFAYQLKCHLQPGDLVVAFSVSGDSENVVRAVLQARKMGGLTVGLTGFDGGRLRRCCDLSIHVPSTRDEYGPVEDVFSCIGHIVTTHVTMRRGRQLSH